MPGLLPNTLSGFSATPSASRASTRGPFPKPFTERSTTHADDASGTHPSVAKAMRLSHFPALQAMGVQSRLNPVTEPPKNMGLCPDRRTPSIGKKMFEYDSSGSEHDPSSVCLVAMVNDFMEKDSARIERATSRNPAESIVFSGFAEISNSVKSLAGCRDDLEMNLLSDVQAIVDSSVEDHQTAGFACSSRKRMVMSALQKRGYDAAICKTRWDHSNGVSAGDYEYIDVMFTSDSPAEPLRLLLDVEFQAQFEIARPSSEFLAILQLVPPIFVGRSQRLQQMVHIMAEATKQSLRIQGMHLPPWRKLNYMKAKWFSAYKRTTKSLANRSSSRKQADDARDSVDSAITGAYKSNARCMNELENLYHGFSKPLREANFDVDSQINLRDDLITVSMTNWQPPPREVRPHLRTARMQSKAIGLTSMLLHAPDHLTCNEVVANAA